MPNGNNFLEVPVDELSAETLERIVDAFVIQDLDDANHANSVERRRHEVIERLASGQAVLMFERERAICHLVARQHHHPVASANAE